MKKNFALAAAIVFACQIGNAQTKKGNQNLGAYLNFNNTSSTNVSTPTPYNASVQKSKYGNFSIGPNYGYFIADGLELGGMAYFTTGHQETESVYNAYANINKQNSNSLGVTAFVKKYFLYDNKFGFRAGPYASYNYGKTTYDNTPATIYNTTPSKYHGYGVGATLELVYYPSNKLGIAANLANIGYTHNKSKGVDESTTNNFNAYFANQNLGISVFYVFGNK